MDRPMQITFRKHPGVPALGIAFFWKLTLESRSAVYLREHFIPELFFDYLFIRRGNVTRLDETHRRKAKLPQQTLKTLHSHSVILLHTGPLVLFGARLDLKFAELYWKDTVQPNQFLEQNWVEGKVDDLETFAEKVTEHVTNRRVRKTPYPMLKHSLQESDWLVHYSPRHKRRLYKSTFGMSRQEMQNIQNLHTFLEESCDFGVQNPRIIQHLDHAVFHDQPHLNHIFKKMTGYSPTEYFETNSMLQENLMSASYNAGDNTTR
jgi:AraC-like DNA-binding protein